MKNDPPRQDPLATRDDFLVVAIGASAGGLEACRKFLTALPSPCGMAFILVQHLDPDHHSLLVDLLSSHTSMPVQEATDGMPIEPDKLYVIPPGAELHVLAGALRISELQRRRGARLLFDVLLQSLAVAYGKRVVAVVLSGSGLDGQAALQSVKSQIGLVIAQDPSEAGSDGMPRSAIDAGVVDLVLPASGIPPAVLDFDVRRTSSDKIAVANPLSTVEHRLPEFISLLREQTPHDFTFYKPGTLQRRIERRMALMADGRSNVDAYLSLLRSQPHELEQLANEVLINVTRFFRDPEIFVVMATSVIPGLIASRNIDQTLRVWVPACSTGQEAYSLAILLLEHISELAPGISLQVFASDADADAVATAREGWYPDAIAADVSSSRLGRYFNKEKQGYRVAPELRSVVVFACQDILADAPFSRLDLISCRNLFIYLNATAQKRVIDLFHFALREGGILLLGNTESIAADDSRFVSVSAANRIYRHAVMCRPGEVGFDIVVDDSARSQRMVLQEKRQLRPNELADLCRRIVIDNYAPAAVLINLQHECLYSAGPTERFLHVAPGHPTHDLLDMIPPGIRARLRMAIAQAGTTRARTQAREVRAALSGGVVEISIDVIPVFETSDPLFLVCFTETGKDIKQGGDGSLIELAADRTDLPHVAAVQIELEATRSDLHFAVYDLERLREERQAIAEEASSVAEEYQSTNEELLTSKEELQSLNEELTSLNGQLHETLERQRTTSDYLQNILYSTDIATIFLDVNLRIRFFTPASKQMFNVIQSDVGRPLGDLSSLAADHAVLDDARIVLKTLAPIEREIEMPNGVWFMRRILPYRTQDDCVEGVVVTFTNVSERKRTAEALQAATRQAQAANVAKSRFLAIASHDLRQPLQSLVLIHGLLAKQGLGEKPRRLLERLDSTLLVMSGMLNTLLDINQIEIGAVEPNVINSPVNEILMRLRDDFTYHAQARSLSIRVVPSSLTVTTDPRLLEQMLRNLLSNALKYTERGKILLGCRRRNGVVSVEVWDTGIGIPKSELKIIFDEYYQIGNPARQRSQGLGLGLSIVQRLADLLGHRIDVHSLPGKGSGFAIEIKHCPDRPASVGQVHMIADAMNPPDYEQEGRLILIVEDDPEVRNLLEDFLVDEGYHALLAADGPAAEQLLSRAAVQPDMLITDCNLPGGMNGLELAARLRSQLHPDFPVIVLTGDISASTLRSIGLSACAYLNKPVKIADLSRTIKRLLPRDRTNSPPSDQPAKQSIVYVVDDDSHVRDQVRAVLEGGGWVVAEFATAEAFLEAFEPGGGDACLLIDAYLPGMSGIELLQSLTVMGHRLPAIMITGFSDVEIAVQAMKSGALDFVEKPVGRADLLAAIARAVELSHDGSKLIAVRHAAAGKIAALTHRQREIMDRVLAGHPNKNIAADLGISQRTVENHRAAIMTRTGVKSLPELARLAVAAASDIAASHLAPGRADEDV